MDKPLLVPKKLLKKNTKPQNNLLAVALEK